ncbi:FixH family protein [Paenibacillus oenotherae]|uniref:FixH family protein n=1 Tax=Paenibacillus oenotherae TaxID=1435645 RepID=A0ABS7CZX4_9BACL|nr:FixH family protein [Paenibacillus oenotherae]MBW7473194.1 FixH family protein [Paenibacillus oenotherae]
MNSRKKLTTASTTAVLAAAAVIAVIRAQAGAAEATPPVVTQTVEGMNAQIKLGTYPAKILQNNAFTVTLTDQDGLPVVDSKLDVVLSMPSMLCGDAAFDLKEVSPGVYEGEMIPIMTGIWEATVTAELDGSSTTFTRKVKAER